MGRVGRAEGIDEVSETIEEVKDRETRGHGDELRCSYHRVNEYKILGL